MNGWIIVSAVLALGCGALAAACVRLRGRIEAQENQKIEEARHRREVDELRGEIARRRRENAAVHRALEDEQDRCDALDDQLKVREDQLRQAEARAERADARRIETEKAVSAGRMRASLLEGQVERLEREQAAQEALYQDILREKEETILHLQDQQKRRARRKVEVLDQQVSINDILEGL